MTNLLKITKKHNINEKFTSAKPMDKENRIFMSENYIIKLYYPKKYKYYYNELEVYKGLSDKDYIPKLYYYGEEETFKYIIFSKLKGKSLFENWKNLNEEQKKNVVIQISKIIKDINKIKISTTNFKNILKNLFNEVIDELDYSPFFLNYLKDLFNSKIQFISEEEICNLIHIDIHFYNFFIDGDKVYAYDFENTILAPLDYQLIRWYKMWKYPQKFYYPKDSMTKNEINEYQIIMPVLLNSYQELSNHDYFEDRIKLYTLIYLLQEAKRLKLPESTTEEYIKENIKIKLKEL